jgi:hypothetical protein
MANDRPMLITRVNSKTYVQLIDQVPAKWESGKDAESWWLNSPRPISRGSLEGFDGGPYADVFVMLNGMSWEKNDNNVNRVAMIVTIDVSRVREGVSANRRVYFENKYNIYGYRIVQGSVFPLDDERWESVSLQRPLVLLSCINDILFRGRAHQKRGTGITYAHCLRANPEFRAFLTWVDTQRRPLDGLTRM